MSRISCILMWAGMLGLAVFVAFLGGELLCRRALRHDVWLPPPPAKINPYGENPYIKSARPYGYFHIPNAQYIQSRLPSYEVSYAINSLGFRGPEFAFRPPSGTKRLLVVGDSVVEGHGSEYAKIFPSLLDRDLRTDGWEVINCGVQGASPMYYALNLERYLNLHPDTILLVLFDNDLFEDRTRESYYGNMPFLATPDYLLSGVNPDGKPRRSSMFAESRLLRLLEQTVGHSLISKAGVPPRALLHIIQHNRKTHASLSHNAEQQEVSKLSPYIVASSLFDIEWEMSAAYLDYVVEELGRRNVRLVVAYLSLHNLHATISKEVRRHALTLNEKISAWADKRRVPFLSLVPAISELSEASLTRLILANDGHPAEEGHRFLAEHLQAWLRQTILSGS